MNSQRPGTSDIVALATHRPATRDAASSEPQWREKLRDGSTVLMQHLIEVAPGRRR